MKKQMVHDAEKIPIQFVDSVSRMDLSNFNSSSSFIYFLLLISHNNFFLPALPQISSPSWSLSRDDILMDIMGYAPLMGNALVS